MHPRRNVLGYTLPKNIPMSYRQNSFSFEILLIMCFKLPDNKIEYGRSALHNLDRINHVWIGLPV